MQIFYFYISSYNDYCFTKNDKKRSIFFKGDDIYFTTSPFEDRRSLQQTEWTTKYTTWVTDVNTSLDTMLSLTKLLTTIDEWNRTEIKNGIETDFINEMIYTLIKMHSYFKTNSDIESTALVEMLHNSLYKIVMNLDIKSISDCMQYTAVFHYGLDSEDLPNGPYIPEFLNNDLLQNTHKHLFDIFYRICKYMTVPDLFFISSDKLALACSNFISNRPKICTRKDNTGTVTVFCQSKLMSFIACIIGNSYDTVNGMFANIPLWVDKLLQKIQLCKRKIFKELTDDAIENLLDYLTSNYYKYLNTYYTRTKGKHPNVYDLINYIIKENNTCASNNILYNFLLLSLFINNITGSIIIRRCRYRI